MPTHKIKHFALSPGILILSTFIAACGSAGVDSDPNDANLSLGAAHAIIEATQSPESSVPITQTPSTQVDTAIPSAQPSVAEPTAEPEPEPVPEFEPEPKPEPIPEPTPQTEPAVEPEPVPETAGCSALPQEIQASTMYLINQARAESRMCGNREFAAAPDVTWNAQLQAASTIHSTDMATHNFFSHTGSDGSSASMRVTTQNYDWRTVGENIAAGQPTTAAVIQAWLDSPGHCENIMNPAFEETAVVCVEDQGAQYRYYWTNLFGTAF